MPLQNDELNHFCRDFIITIISNNHRRGKNLTTAYFFNVPESQKHK